MRKSHSSAEYRARRRAIVERATILEARYQSGELQTIRQRRALEAQEEAEEKKSLGPQDLSEELGNYGSIEEIDWQA